MRTFPPQFILEKNRKIGAAPFYILKCPFPATGTIYLSDHALPIASWNGGIVTRSWVKSWGQVRENISNSLALAALSTFSLAAIIDQHGYPSLRTILDTAANNVETTDCELYLAFRDIIEDISDSPPQLLWRGNITDWEYVDEQNVTLMMSDISVRLDRYVGVKLDTAAFPDAHPDDIGKVKPLVYGPDNMITCLRSVWGARTTLKAEITAAATTCYVSDAEGLPSSGSIWIDDERIAYTSITTTVGATETTYRLNGMTRGQGGTTATGHSAGAQVWEYLANYDSIAAAHALKAIRGIYAAIGGDLLQVSSGVSTVFSGGDTILRATQKITVKSALDTIGITDTIGVSDTTGVNDAGHYHDNVQTANQYATASNHGAGAGNWTWTGADLNLRDSDLTTSLKANYYGTSADAATMTCTFPTYTGPTPSSVFAVITHQSYKSAGAPAGARVRYGTTDLDTSNTKVTQRVSLGTSVPTSITVSLDHPVSATGYQVTSDVYEIALEINATRTSTELAAVSKSGSVAKTGTVAKTGGVVATRTVDHFVVRADGYGDDSSGTYTGTPSALISRPDHVVKHFLALQAAWPVGAFFSDLAPACAFYSFSIVIDSYSKLKQWLGKMAWECRCYFRFSPSRAELRLRLDTPVSLKTVTDAQVGRLGDGRTTMKIRRSSLEEVINKVQVHYYRDGTKSGTDSYRSVTAAAVDAASVARYGEKERPELFSLDFVQAQAMAISLRDFYLAVYKYRKRIVEAQAFLDNAELEFADPVTISLGDGATVLAEVQSANLEPGSARDGTNDKITLTAREY